MLDSFIPQGCLALNKWHRNHIKINTHLLDIGWHTQTPHSLPQLRCVGTTQRSKSRPLGTNTGATLGGNIMASRCAILLCVAFARGLFWVLEQPKGSLFQYHPSMQTVFRLRKCFKHHLNMFHYGAESMKGTWLYSGQLFYKGVAPA